MKNFEKTIGGILMTIGSILLSGIIIPVRGNIYAIIGSFLLVVIGFYIAFGNLSFKRRTLSVLVALATGILFFVIGVIYYKHNL